MYLIFLVSSFELTWPAFVDGVLGAAVLSTSCGQIQEGGFFSSWKSIDISTNKNVCFEFAKKRLPLQNKELVLRLLL